jgi:hypothetical protein
VLEHYAIKACGGSGAKLLCIHNMETRWRCLCSSGKGSRFAVNWRLGLPKVCSRLGGEEISLTGCLKWTMTMMYITHHYTRQIINKVR